MDQTFHRGTTTGLPDAGCVVTSTQISPVAQLLGRPLLCSGDAQVTSPRDGHHTQMHKEKDGRR